MNEIDPAVAYAQTIYNASLKHVHQGAPENLHADIEGDYILALWHVTFNRYVQMNGAAKLAGALKECLKMIEEEPTDAS